MASRFDAALAALDQGLRDSRAIRSWLRSRRWCGDSIGVRAEVTVTDRALLSDTPTEAIVLFLLRAKDAGVLRAIHLPLSVSSVRQEPDAFEFVSASGRFFVTEAERSEGFARFLAEGFRRGAKIRTENGDQLTFQGESFGSFRGIKGPVGGGTSNLLLGISTQDREVVVKSYKLLDPRNREPDILARLSRKAFAFAPTYLGEASLGRGDGRLVLGVATERVDAVDLFAWHRDGWRGVLSGGSALEEFVAASEAVARELAAATASLHETLVDRRPGPWQVESFTEDDARIAYRTGTGYLADALRRSARMARQGAIAVADAAARARSLLLDLRPSIEAGLEGLEACVGTAKSVTHGDLHLAQVLRRTSDGGLLFIDFEGEPERFPRSDSPKLPPLRDVATMARSFAYVKHVAWLDFVGADPGSPMQLLAPDALPAERRESLERLVAWEAVALEGFIREYRSRSTLYPNLDGATGDRIIRSWAIQKALYELRYELMHRPENFEIPLEGIVALAGGARSLR